MYHNTLQKHVEDEKLLKYELKRLSILVLWLS